MYSKFKIDQTPLNSDLLSAVSLSDGSYEKKVQYMSPTMLCEMVAAFLPSQIHQS